MKKILFVSDLDGTLLTPAANLPEGVAERINRLTSDGVMITYATARTVRSVSFILEDIDFTAKGASPVALMNGVLVRDMAKGCYVRAAVLEGNKAREIYEAVTSVGGLEPFVYALDNENPVNGDPLVTYYRSIANEAMKSFMDERVEKFGKPFIKMEDIGDVCGDTVYFAVLGDEEKISAAAALAEKISGIRLTYYRDAYNENLWYLEIFDENASKKHAVHYLRQITGADEVIAFGDNRNDIPMFEEADIAVAVENAAPEAKNAADHITKNVVDFIENYIKNGEIK